MSMIYQIKSTISLIDALERYTGEIFYNIRTNRSRFNIRCPFHNDRNPSFTVYMDTNTFRCWSGCNEGKPGDVIDFVRLFQNVDTKEAIKLLIDDYGLKNPDSEQAKKWRKNRAYQKQVVALEKKMNERIINNIGALKKVEDLARVAISSIKTVEDMERIGELYHVTVEIDYWMECLTANDPFVQFQTLQEVSRSLKRISREVGDKS